jgi:hypothetical protein
MNAINGTAIISLEEYQEFLELKKLKIEYQEIINDKEEFEKAKESFINYQERESMRIMSERHRYLNLLEREKLIIAKEAAYIKMEDWIKMIKSNRIKFALGLLNNNE